jgi:hypothetical protein
MPSKLEEKLRSDLMAVANEVGHLWQYHDLFWTMTEITNNNERVSKVGGDFLNWFKNSYIESGSMAFRRQLDKDSRSISLINVLREILKNHEQFTREGFQRNIAFAPGHPMHKLKKAEWDEAGETFDALFGNGGQLDPAIVQAEIDLLESEAAAIREQANKEIAHKDRKGMQAAKATGEIFEKCLGHLDELVNKYSHLLNGKPYGSLRPRFEYDVEEIFTFPWKA